MPELDSVRGIAILMVLFFHGFASQHGTGWFGGGIPKFAVNLASIGWMGVNLFFALSGFLITGILLDSKPRPGYYKRFYLRRALRILPAYYAILSLILIIGRTALHEDVSLKFLGLSAVYMANLTVLFGVPMQYTVLWSLAVEEHFYLIWPAIVRNFSSRTVGGFAVAIGLAATIARMFAFWGGHYDFDHSHYTWLVADALAFGSLLAVLMRRRMGTRTGLMRIVLAALCFAALLVIDKPLGQHWAGGALHLTALNLTCTAAVAGALLLGTSSWSGLIQVSILRFFGEISYGLYLIHVLLFNIFDNWQTWFFPRVTPYYLDFKFMLFRFMLCGGFAVLLAFLSRRYFEEPFLRLKDRLMAPRTFPKSRAEDRGSERPQWLERKAGNPSNFNPKLSGRE
ncbi:MAG TPA: acyltransferase [Candidatus Sulfotelmatobacter sp.]